MDQTKATQILQTIIVKAWKEETFKQQLIANPIHSIQEATGVSVKLPAGKKISVQDQTDPSVLYLNIPMQLDIEDLELNEQQLEAIAGGEKIPPKILDNTKAVSMLLD